jgi:biotin carboxylase/acetyl-CoA carboxylase carboxyltransferase component/biotin carboxyl carrier protein
MATNVLIANRGLSALKFILSIREWLVDADYVKIKMFGFVTPVDISSKYKYITMLDQAIYTDDNSIYTNIDDIVKYCKEYDIQCVFPGWGYLSENEDFVKALTNNGITFLGPTYENMHAIGNKISCNNVAHRLGVPVLPFSGDRQLTTLEEIEQWCDTIGYPVMLKAGNSGGGKGIRIVRDKSKCYEMWQEIIQEVVNPMIYATKYIENASHLEIQILGDGTRSIHLHGRDCTTQRRNQKLIEECPIQKDQDIINNIQSYAVRIANHIHYRGLATVEFIYDQDTKDVFILEINPRIQVEHIITEQLFGLNLMKLLFLVAIGNKLDDICELRNLSYKFDKHIISVRINSENPYEDFRPTIGKIHEIDITYNRKSWGYFSVSNDSHISETVDSQFGHILAVGNSRKSAINNITGLIDTLKIRGTIYNTAGFLKNFVNSASFTENRHTTRFLNDQKNTGLYNTKYADDSVALLGMLYNAVYRFSEQELDCYQKLADGHNYPLRLLNAFTGTMIFYNDVMYEYKYIFELTRSSHRKCVIEYCGKNYAFVFEYADTTMVVKLENDYLYTVVHSYNDDTQFEVLINQHKYNFVRQIKDDTIRSPVNGKVVECVFKNGTMVSEGDAYIKIECMKMILPFKAHVGGIIRYFVKPGDIVVSNQLIGEFDNGNENLVERVINTRIFDKYAETDQYDTTRRNNVALINKTSIPKQPDVDASEYPSMFSTKYETLFTEFVAGSVGYLVDRRFVLLVNNLKRNNGVFSCSEDEYYFKCLRYARDHRYPFVFIASNSGAEIKINELVKFEVKPHIVEGELKYLYLDPAEYACYANEVNGTFRPEYNHYEITCVNNPGLTNLDGSALLVSEMAKARNDILTITFVVDRTVGVGAYLARLSERIVQRSDSPILLTGFQAINKVMGQELYDSNAQLGGPTVMAKNGISHKVVDTTREGIDYIKRLLYYTSTQPSRTTLPSAVVDIIDENTFVETMDQYAKNVITGRCLIKNKRFGLIYAVDEITNQFRPCDPANLASANQTTLLSPNILYPDTSYKIAKTIRDCNVEGIDLLIIANWRGFSGGTRDMYDNVLDFGSMIVTELTYYNFPVTIYIPPGGELRGGSMVVFSKSINREFIRFYASSTARINVLEANATKELKYKLSDKSKYSLRHGIYDVAMLESIAMRYVELNDGININNRVLDKYETVVNGFAEPDELRKLI